MTAREHALIEALLRPLLQYAAEAAGRELVRVVVGVLLDYASDEDVASELERRRTEARAIDAKHDARERALFDLDEPDTRSDRPR